MTSLRRSPILLLATLPAFVFPACSSDGGLISTGSVGSPDASVASASMAKADSACVTLASQIDGLRKEGTAGRLEAAAAGTSATVPVLRASLKKQADLNKANADFQARCSKVPMAPTSAQAPALPASAAVAAAAPAAGANVAASGVTSVAAATGAAKKAVSAAVPAAASVPAAQKPAE